MGVYYILKPLPLHSLIMNKNNQTIWKECKKMISETGFTEYFEIMKDVDISKQTYQKIKTIEDKITKLSKEEKSCSKDCEPIWDWVVSIIEIFGAYQTCV